MTQKRTKKNHLNITHLNGRKVTFWRETKDNGHDDETYCNNFMSWRHGFCTYGTYVYDRQDKIIENKEKNLSQDIFW